jgi:hypothetical protein
MGLDIRSFVMGWGVGVISGPMLRRLQPFVMELAAAAGEFTDRAAVGVAQGGERLQDLFGEAREAFARRRGGAASRGSERERTPRRRARSGGRARRGRSRRAASTNAGGAA